MKTSQVNTDSPDTTGGGRAKLRLVLQGNKALSKEHEVGLAEYIESVGTTIHPMWGFFPEYQKDTAVLVFLGKVLSWLTDGMPPLFSVTDCVYGACGGMEIWKIKAGELEICRIDESGINESWQSLDHKIWIESQGFPDGLALEWNGEYNADLPFNQPTVTIQGITASMAQKIINLANQMFEKCHTSLDRMSR